MNPYLIEGASYTETIPAGLAGRVRDLLADDPSMTWDTAVAEIAGQTRQAS